MCEDDLKTKRTYSKNPQLRNSMQRNRFLVSYKWIRVCKSRLAVSYAY